MKKKTIRLEVVALILGVFIIASVNTNAMNISRNVKVSNITEENDNSLKWPKYYIRYFEYCSISGSYISNTTNDKFQIIVESDSDTIFVRGIASVYTAGDIPQRIYCSIKTDKIKAVDFVGECSDGYIKGIGYEYVDIGKYHHVLNREVKSIQKQPNPKKNYQITGSGYCAGISINGDWLYSEIYGDVKANLSIWNSRHDCPHIIRGYNLQIKNLSNGEIKTKWTLPKTIKLTDFEGNGFIKNIHVGKGWHYAHFKISGYASECNFDETRSMSFNLNRANTFFVFINIYYMFHLVFDILNMSD